MRVDLESYLMANKSINASLSYAQESDRILVVRLSPPGMVERKGHYLTFGTVLTFSGPVYWHFETIEMGSDEETIAEVERFEITQDYSPLIARGTFHLYKLGIVKVTAGSAQLFDKPIEPMR